MRRGNEIVKMLSRSMKRTGANEFSNGSLEIREWAVMEGGAFRMLLKKEPITFCQESACILLDISQSSYRLRAGTREKHATMAIWSTRGWPGSCFCLCGQG